MRILGGAADVPHEDAALAAFGLYVERAEPNDTQTWPENMDIVEVFEFMQTQWQVAPAGGVVGLRYEALPMALDACGVAGARRAEVTRGVRVMEAAGIDYINGKK